MQSYYLILFGKNWILGAKNSKLNNMFDGPSQMITYTGSKSSKSPNFQIYFGQRNNLEEKRQSIEKRRSGKAFEKKRGAKDLSRQFQHFIPGWGETNRRRKLHLCRWWYSDAASDSFRCFKIENLDITCSIFNQMVS